MKITNKTVAWAIPITILGIILVGINAEYYIHGCDYWNSQCGWSELRVVVLLIYLLFGMFCLGTYLNLLFSDEIQFEYEIKLPKSKRKTLNNLYSKMGEAAMKGDEAEEKRLWKVIQKIENE